jgi:hypothetical protein
MNIANNTNALTNDEISGELLVTTIIYYVTAFIIIVLSLIFINNKI